MCELAERLRIVGFAVSRQRARISRGSPSESDPVMPSFGILSLDFTPELDSLLLSGAAIASLVVLGFARSRHATPPHG